MNNHTKTIHHLEREANRITADSTRRLNASIDLMIDQAFTVRSNDGDFEFIGDVHEVRDRQREEDVMQREKEEAYRDRANKGLMG